MMSDAVDKKSARRRRGVLVGAAMLLIIIAGALTVLTDAPANGWRAVDIARISALILPALVLSARATTAFSLIGRTPALDDELTRANRSSSARVGYWAMILAALVCLLISFIEPLTGTAAAAIILIAGAVSAALRFVVLEGRGSG
jgi:hypothetical protein